MKGFRFSRHQAVRAAQPHAAPAQAVPSSPALTSEELMLLALVAQGLPTAAVARRLCTSERTVRRRDRGSCDRLGVTAPIQAVVWAARRRIL